MLFTIIRDDVEMECNVELIYHKATSGARDSLGGISGAGPPLEPDEPAEFEIESVSGPNGEEIELNQTEEEVVIQKAFEEIEHL